MSVTASIAASRPPAAPPEPAHSRASAEAAQSPAVEAASPVTPGPNPSQRLDPALGIIILQFHDGSGKTVTLPTQRMLAAYRLAGGPVHAEPAAKAPPEARPEPAPTPETAAPQADAPKAAAPEAATSN
jgi:hypothetical protein